MLKSYTASDIASWLGKNPKFEKDFRQYVKRNLGKGDSFFDLTSVNEILDQIWAEIEDTIDHGDAQAYNTYEVSTYITSDYGFFENRVNRATYLASMIEYLYPDQFEN